MFYLPVKVKSFSVLISSESIDCGIWYIMTMSFLSQDFICHEGLNSWYNIFVLLYKDGFGRPVMCYLFSVLFDYRYNDDSIVPVRVSHLKSLFCDSSTGITGFGIQVFKL